MHIDLLAFPGHKSLFGPTGTGALYVGPRAKVHAWREGGTGGDSSNETQPREYPYYLEGGTPNVLGVAGLAAGVEWVQEQGLDRIHENESALIERLWQKLDEIGGLVDQLGGLLRRVAVLARQLSEDRLLSMLEHYRHWKALTPEERRAASANVQRFRGLPPEERRRIVEDLERWSELGEARREELRAAHERWQRLAPERRERILERYRRWQTLSPEERERITENWRRWRAMTPDERARARDHLRERAPHGPPGVHPGR